MNEQLTALYHAVNVLMARIGEHGHAGSRDPETSAVMDALAAIDGGQYKPDLAIAAQGEAFAYCVPSARVCGDGSWEDGPDTLVFADECSEHGKKIGTPLYTHARQPVVPEGFVMVPREPTQGMLEQMRLTEGFTYMELAKRYACMLAAAPTPEAQPQGEVVSFERPLSALDLRDM